MAEAEGAVGKRAGRSREGRTERGRSKRRQKESKPRLKKVDLLTKSHIFSGKRIRP